jgi:hypothetical protein
VYNLVNQKIVDYIKTNKNKFSVSDLKNALIKQGYSQKDVNEAAKIAQADDDSLPPMPSRNSSSNTSNSNGNFLTNLLQGRSFGEYFAKIKTWVFVIWAGLFFQMLIDFIPFLFGGGLVASIFGLFTGAFGLFIGVIISILDVVFAFLIGYNAIKKDNENMKYAMAAGGVYGACIGVFAVASSIISFSLGYDFFTIIAITLLPFTFVGYIIGGLIFALIGGLVAGGKFE